MRKRIRYLLQQILAGAGCGLGFHAWALVEFSFVDYLLCRHCGRQLTMTGRRARAWDEGRMIR